MDSEKVHDKKKKEHLHLSKRKNAGNEANQC